MSWRGGGSTSQVAREDDEVVGKAFDARLMRRLLPFIWEQRAQLGAALVSSAIVAAGQLAGPWLTLQAVDQGILRGDYRVLTDVALIYIVFHFLTWGASRTK